LKRLAYLWFACAAVGFAVAAGLVLAVAYAFDGGRSREPAHDASAHAQPSRLGAASAPIIEGRRLVGD
jgi:hypothetical protein